MSALDLRNHLIQLQAERALALAEGLGGVEAYMAEIDEDIAFSEQAYVGAAVTEIATLRAQLSGPQVG